MCATDDNSDETHRGITTLATPEARGGIEPPHGGFADPSVSTSPPSQYCCACPVNAKPCGEDVNLANGERPIEVTTLPLCRIGHCTKYYTGPARLFYRGTHNIRSQSPSMFGSQYTFWRRGVLHAFSNHAVTANELIRPSWTRCMISRYS